MLRLRPALTSRLRSCARGQTCRCRRGRRRCQHGAGVTAGQATLGQPGESGQRGGVEPFEQRADLVAQLLTRPDRVLLSAREYPDRLRQFGIGGQRPVRGDVGAQDVGQQHRVGGVGLRAGDLVAAAIPRRGQRVDRVDHPPGRAQCADQQPVVGLDRHRHRALGGVPGLGQQRQQRGEPGRVITDPRPGHHLAGVIDDGDVMVPQPNRFRRTGQSSTSLSVFLLVRSLSGVTRRPNHRTRWSDISLAVRDSSAPQDLVLSKSSKAREHPSRGRPCGGLEQRHPITTQAGLPPGAAVLS